MSNQLVKKNPAEGYQNIFPKTWIDAIKDKESGVSLQEILQGFNMYFLSYNGSRALTRCKIPTVLRKEGLWITYVLYDHTVVTEWYNSDQIDDNSWSMDSNWRVASNALVGDVSVSADGYWVINGEKTEAKAQGEQGVTPLLRVGANNKLQVSYNAGKAWKDISDYIVPRFRWNQDTGTSAGTIQISMDLGKTWTNLSNEITNNLRISRYIDINESLPTSGVAEGTIYMKGPYYGEGDTSNANPIYRMWVYAWKGNTLAWQDNGEFTSISTGVVQERGTSTTEVMSQDAVTKELTKLEEEVSQLGQEMDNNFGVDYTSSLLANKKIVIQANIGDVVDVTPQDQPGFNCICVPAKKMEVFKFTGQGSKGPRLWAILDKDYKLDSVASANAHLADYALIVPKDGFIVYNSGIAEGNYFKSYGTLLQNTINVTVEYPLEPNQFYTLTTAIAAIPIERRRPCQTLIFLTGAGLVSMYSYKAQLVDDIYWNDTSRWVKWLQDADLSAINEAITTLLSDKQKVQEYENGLDLTSTLQTGKCYRIGSLNIGDTVSLTPETQSGIDCLLYQCKEGDTFLVKGYGASGPRLWGFLDTDAKLLSKCETENYQTPSEGIYLTAPKDGYLIINTHPYQGRIVKLLGHNPDNFIKKSKWLAMGDSITEGYYSYGEGQYAITHDCWANYVKFIKGYNLINKGTGGQGYAHGPSCARIAVDELIAQNAFDGVNLVTLAYGVNDWKYNETLGSMDDEVSASAANIIPSMRYVIERLIAANPKMKIIVIMPINCCAYGEKVNNWGIGFAFSNNGTLQQIYEAFVGVCNYYGVQYIDMLHYSSINRENIESLLLDGVHPSMDGHKLMARELAEKITCY